MIDFEDLRRMHKHPAGLLDKVLALVLGLGLSMGLGPVQAQAVSGTGGADRSTASAPAETLARLREASHARVDPLLRTLQELVEIESGSQDLAGLRQLAGLYASKLQSLNFTTEIIPARAPDFHPQLKGAELGPMVYGRKMGRGQRKVLLIAHMDTVYAKGSLTRQPFRRDGDRAYGVGIADDKAGMSLILHAAQMLQDLGLDDYAELAVLINGDEELGSPGSSAMLTELGSQYDAVFSFEGGGGSRDMVRLATSSIAIVEMRVHGRASHAGGNPQGGRNALYELAHQILKTRQFGDPAKGLQINWTVAQAGDVRNVIPAQATAVADVRSFTNEDLELMERMLREAIQDRLIPDTRIELIFHRSRPAFVANAASVTLARHAQSVFGELGLPLEVRDKASGGGTDAAFAALRARGGVLESFGLRGFGAHSNDNESVVISSIAPRLYLAARMILDVGSGRLKW